MLAPSPTPSQRSHWDRCGRLRAPATPSPRPAVGNTRADEGAGTAFASLASAPQIECTGSSGQRHRSRCGLMRRISRRSPVRHGSPMMTLFSRSGSPTNSRSTVPPPPQRPGRCDDTSRWRPRTAPVSLSSAGPSSSRPHTGRHLRPPQLRSPLVSMRTPSPHRTAACCTASHRTAPHRKHKTPPLHQFSFEGRGLPSGADSLTLLTPPDRRPGSPQQAPPTHRCLAQIALRDPSHQKGHLSPFPSRRSGVPLPTNGQELQSPKPGKRRPEIDSFHGRDFVEPPREPPRDGQHLGGPPPHPLHPPDRTMGPSDRTSSRGFPARRKLEPEGCPARQKLGRRSNFRVRSPSSGLTTGRGLGNEKC